MPMKEDILVMCIQGLRRVIPAYWDHAQDFYNNEVGIAIESATAGKSDAEVAMAVMKALQNGQLVLHDYTDGIGFIRSDRIYAEWLAMQGR
jgi:hypothetical protein